MDMAGSERQGQTHASGERLRESGLINKTLSVIRRVVAGRSDPTVISPYNESVLTRLLKRTLSGADARRLSGALVFTLRKMTNFKRFICVAWNLCRRGDASLPVLRVAVRCQLPEH